MFLFSSMSREVKKQKENDLLRVDFLNISTEFSIIIATEV